MATYKQIRRYQIQTQWKTYIIRVLRINDPDWNQVRYEIQLVQIQNTECTDRRSAILRAKALKQSIINRMLDDSPNENI